VAVVGFDFGTTNSLASVVIGTEVITFLENEQPIPSVVSFEGGKVEVGRKAHDKLTSAGPGRAGQHRALAQDAAWAARSRSSTASSATR
jgi:molecular chaperone DnaK